MTTKDAVYALFSFMNFARIFEYSTGAYLGHFWSLSVEEQFYLLWPITLILFFRFKLPPVVVIAFIIIVIFIFQSTLIRFFGYAVYVRIYHGLDTRALQLLFGCLIAFVPNNKALSPALLVIPLCIFGIAIFVLQWNEPFYLHFGMPLAAILSASIILHMASVKSILHKPFEWRIMQWGGERSYAIYLWHYPILGCMVTVGQDLGLHPLAPIIISFMLTCAAAELSYRYIEIPSRELRVNFDGTLKRGLI